MKAKPVVILPLAAALASLGSAANASTSPANSTDVASGPADPQIGADKVQPNTIFKSGEDLFGLLVTTNADGMVVAQHASHYSHSSHASHASHASSAY